MADPRQAPERFADAGDQLHAAAAAQACSDDFGPADYKVGLKVLLESMDYDPRFHEQGRRAVWSQFVDALASRAVAHLAMAQNPGFDRQDIRRPIVITGFPRTGTTALHKLMAVDPQFQGPEKWLLAAPKPRPPKAQWKDDPHFIKEVELLNARFGAMPEQRAAHNMVAEEVDECLWLQRQSFVSNFWTCQCSAATYDAWWQTQTEAESYAYLKRCYQLIGGAEPDKRWLLKNPSHILRLDQLFGAFPDALVIQTHRDPAKSVPSLCALLMHGFPLIEEGRADLHARILLEREAVKWAKGVRDAEPVRQARRSQVMDVIHAEFYANPMKVVRQIYNFVGLELRPEVEAAMEARIAAAPEKAHGEHRYDVADFGMTEEDVRDRFGDYVQRFDLVARGSR